MPKPDRLKQRAAQLEVVAAAKASQLELSVQVSGADGDRVRLIAVGDSLAGDDGLAIRMTDWRIENADSFGSRFTPSASRTQKWLVERVVGNPQRILFILFDAAGRPLGHVGVVLHDDAENGIELDAVLRGERDGPSGYMAAAIMGLHRWVVERLDADAIELKVLGSNLRAIAFYQQLGYLAVKETAVRWFARGDGESLAPCHASVATDTYVTMECRLTKSPE